MKIESNFMELSKEKKSLLSFVPTCKNKKKEKSVKNMFFV